MPRRKANTNVNDGNGMCVWNCIMDDTLIDAYLHQQTMGNRIGGTFTTHALDNIVNELKGKFPEKTIDKEKAQNRMKNIKRAFTRCYDIFKNGMSGFAWNPTKEMWDAEPKVWKHLIEAKPEAAEWMNKRIRNYEKKHAETASEMRQRRRQNSMNLSGGSSTGAIDDIDFMVSQSTANLENLGNNENIEIQDDDLGDEASPEVPSSSRSKKVRRSYSRDDDSKFSTAVETMSNAFVQSTTAIVEVSKNVLNVTNNILSTFGKNTNSIQASDVWVMLVNLGFSQPFLNKAYLFLINDHKMLEGIMGCPNEHRKSLLLTSMGFDREPHE
ncbi:Cytochrome c/b562 domain-containing protein [Dioscorea alata]|uniref:Cytochrome c/b562 domain-containing protein n=1 Tax=Dioscorea alata TaxID=55571 RepID=A0ACB7WNZ9_DIOAL|nr:Cytochrome c/b562 domain-containing protein [Dioscorea alata]